MYRDDFMYKYFDFIESISFFKEHPVLEILIGAVPFILLAAALVFVIVLLMNLYHKHQRKKLQMQYLKKIQTDKHIVVPQPPECRKNIMRWQANIVKITPANIETYLDELDYYAGIVQGIEKD